MAEDPAVVRLEERVKTLFEAVSKVEAVTRESSREMKQELTRLSGLIENGELVRYQLQDAEKDRTEIRHRQAQCRAQCDTRFDEFSESLKELNNWSQNWRGRQAVIGAIIIFIATAISSVGTAVAIRFLDLKP